MLADLTNTANPIGLACDYRVALHELGGHGILYNHVNGPNFGFAHSAGDSFGAGRYAIRKAAPPTGFRRFHGSTGSSIAGTIVRSVAAGPGAASTTSAAIVRSRSSARRISNYQALGGDSTEVPMCLFRRAATAPTLTACAALGTYSPPPIPPTRSRVRHRGDDRRNGQLDQRGRTGWLLLEGCPLGGPDAGPVPAAGRATAGHKRGEHRPRSMCSSMTDDTAITSTGPAT